MLSCDQVRERLPAAETGEPVDGALHDHLAACAACRAEAARLRADLAALRGELAGLAPSPFLEDAVLAAARTAGAPARHRPWLAPALAAAAAALVVAFVVLARLPGAAPPATAPAAGDPGGPSQVRLPPSHVEAAQRRAKRRAAGPSTDRLLLLAGAPPEGVVLLGRGLLAEMGPAGIRPGPASIEATFARLTAQGRIPELVGVLAAPDGSAEARVVVRVSREYAGHLLVEETLARALGLDRLEDPGGVTLGGDSSWRAATSHARLDVDAWRGDTRCEIWIERAPLPAVPLASGGLPQRQRVVVEGERPDTWFRGGLALHEEGGRAFVVADATGSFGEDDGRPPAVPVEALGPVQAALAYHAGAHPECLVFLPTLDTRDELAWKLRLERVTLKAHFRPGARVTVARVWQGNVAVPSRDSVACTTADAEGLVSIVRVRGERGPLVAREVRADGSVQRSLVLVEPELMARRALPLVLRPDGSVALQAWVFPLFTDPAQGDGGDPAARIALRDKLAELVDAAGRDEHGLARRVVTLSAPPGTPWARLQTLLFLCADMKVRAPSVEFALLTKDSALRYDLPVDPGLVADGAPGTADRPVVKVALMALDDGYVWSWRCGGRGGSGPVDDSARGLPALQAALRGLRPQGPETVLQLTFRPMAPGAVPPPYGEVHRVLQALLDAGAGRLLIEGVPLRVR